jgi:hypothetical protein
MFMIPFMGISQTFSEGGVNYSVTSTNAPLTAAVSGGNSSYSGSLTIPSTVMYNGNNYAVTLISDYAFSNSSSLTSVSIPNTVTSIGNSSFYNNTSLLSVSIPNSVTSIGSLAFANCNALTSITIPSSVTTIQNRAFLGCTGFLSVTALNPNPVTIDSNVFFASNISSIPLYVTSGSAVAYQNTSVWANFYDYIELPPVAVPNASAQTFCSGATVSNLVATGETGAMFSWFTSSTGGMALAPSTVLTSNTYYVSQNVNGQESARTSVSITIQPSPVSPSKYSMVTISNFDADVIANGTSFYGSVTQDFDGYGYYLISDDFYYFDIPTNHLPSDRIISSAQTNGVKFSLGQYDANNSLRITNTNSKNLSIENSFSAKKLYLLASSAGGSSNMDVQIHFSDETSETVQAITVDDWFNGLDYAIKGIGRANNTGLDQNSENPRLYEIQIPISAENQSKIITELTVSKTSSFGVLNIMGLSYEKNNTYTFCSSSNATLADLAVTGNDIKWYTVASGGTVLPANTALVSGNYYVSDIINGCESDRTIFSVTVNTTTSTTTNVTECDSYTWPVNNATYTESGTYTVINGCDTQTLVLVINNSTSNTTTVSTCDNYTWDINNTNYTESGQYIVTSINASGCTHTETLDLTITPSTNNSIAITACDNYTWSVNDQTYTESGSYSFVNGCHTEYLDLVIIPTFYAFDTITECDSFTWAANGLTYTSSGTYVYESLCSVRTLILTINPSTTQTLSFEACDNFTYNGTTYTQSGTYTVNQTNAFGCPNVVTLDLTINNSTSNTSNATACDSYVWSVNGDTYMQTGSYTVTSTNASGCTHTEILNLTINNSTSNTTNTTACDSYTWNVSGNTYTQSGEYTVTSTNANGCTHNEILNLTINNSTSNTTILTACDSYIWPVNGNTYTQSGTYVENSTNASGCSHTETLVLTVNITLNAYETLTACGSYTWPLNGQTYTQSGSYTFTDGCYNTHLALVILPLEIVETTIYACDSYYWQTNYTNYTQSGTYVYEVPLTCRRDILYLLITPTNYDVFDVTACDSYTWNKTGETYTQSGTYYYQNPHTNVCLNSVLNLTINNSTSNTTNASACESYTWSVSGLNYTESGTYSVTSTNASGCTHTETLNLTINTATLNTISMMACDSFYWPSSGMTYTQSGQYTVTSVNENGCEHTEILNLTINTTTTNTTSMVACDSYFWPLNGMMYTQSGEYVFNTVNSNGCLHIEFLNLTINRSTSNTTSITACDGYVWDLNGITYSQSGQYSIISTNANGCLHTEILDLIINNSTTTTTNITACDGYTWTVNNETYSQSGQYNVTSINANGCEHTETLNLTINTSTSNTTSITACDNYTWAVNGQTYTQSGQYSFTSTNEGGCTNVETLNLTINNSTSNTTTITACESYTWPINGDIIPVSGNYVYTTTNANGCTHDEYLFLTINNPTSNTTTITACDSYTWAVNNNTYTQSGEYTFVSTNANGCTHTETLNLTINTSTSSTTSISACDSYTWSANAMTYSQSGTYTFVHGCDTQTLVLTITPSTSSINVVSACDTYTWSATGVTYTQSGTYTFTNGCDTQTLELTITPTTSTITVISACDAYTWPANGAMYSQSGTYTFENGCSLQTLELIISQTVTPEFESISPICSGSTLVLPTSSLNGISGTWLPAINNSATTTYTFTPNANQCATTAQLTVVVTSIATPTGVSAQTLSNGSTLSTIAINGTNIQWYSAANNGNLLPSSTVLVSGTTYYATQTINGCESAALPITITIGMGVAGLLPSQCGVTLSAPNSIVYATPVPNAQMYKFRVTHLGTNQAIEKEYALRNLYLQSLSFYQYNQTYAIEVAVKRNNIWEPYGAPCNITTPIAYTQVRTVQCGATLQSKNTTIYANLVSSALGYRFRVTNTATNSVQLIDRQIRSFSFGTVADYTAGAVYSIDVAVLNTNGEYLPYGPSCSVTTPSTTLKETLTKNEDVLFTVNGVPNPFSDNFKIHIESSSTEPLQIFTYDLIGKLIESHELSINSIENFETGVNYPSGIYNIIVSQGENTKSIRMVKR